MVSITNGVNHMTVTNGVFKEIYAPQGWTKVEEPVVDSAEINEDNLNGSNANEDGSNGSEGEEDDTDEESEDLDEDEESEEDPDNESDEESDEDLLEKPLSELSFEELQRVAALKKVDVSGLRSKKEIRNKLKNML